MKVKISTSVTTIGCKVSLGTFSNERGVLVELPDGNTVSTIVDKRDVFVDKDPPPGGEVKGRVKVFIVGPMKDSVIVDLPQPGLTGGTRLRIPKAFLK